ncbi:hypothetical protein QL996_12805, partial [Planococcus sp. APC 4015]|nr:hypothetical protein [Planococcus sp. APC 4015]
MTDPADDTRLWPASPYDLADAHRCPACFTIVSQITCTACGLVLTDPRTGRLLELGRGILAAELDRQEMIAAIRSAHAPAHQPLPVAAP